MQVLYLAVRRDAAVIVLNILFDTGVDDVQITYQSGMDAWEVNPETGDRTPAGWIKLVKVIERYDTRDLAQWTSGIYLQIEPNERGVERIGYVTVRSFMAEDKVTIKQGF